MDRALVQLMLLRLRGGLRNRLRQLISLRGMTFMLVILSVGWVVVRTFSSIPAEELGGVALDDADAVRESIETYLPIGLLGAWALVRDRLRPAGQRGVASAVPVKKEQLSR